MSFAARHFRDKAESLAWPKGNCVRHFFVLAQLGSLLPQLSSSSARLIFSQRVQSATNAMKGSCVGLHYMQDLFHDQSMTIIKIGMAYMFPFLLHTGDLCPSSESLAYVTVCVTSTLLTIPIPLVGCGESSSNEDLTCVTSSASSDQV